MIVLRVDTKRAGFFAIVIIPSPICLTPRAEGSKQRVPLVFLYAIVAAALPDEVEVQ